MWNLFGKNTICELERRYQEKLTEARQYQGSEHRSDFMAVMHEIHKIYTMIAILRYAKRKLLQTPDMRYRLQ